jgi:hypothetical protein
LRSVPDLQDFDVQELAPGHWRFGLLPPPSPETRAGLIRECAAMARALGAQPPAMDVANVQAQPFAQKQRRIRGLRSLPCAS